METKLEHVFFDLDHTLWDFDRNSGLAFAKMFHKNNIQVDLSTFLEVYSPINFQYWKWYREERVTKAQLRYGRFKKTFEKLGYRISDNLIDTLSEDYILYLPEHNFLFDGAHELLSYLQERYVLHIITNGFEEVQTKKLDNSNIASFFKTVTTSEAAGVKKPNPIIFEKALNDAGAIAGKSMMIGDTYEADIVGANALGMKTICFNYHNAQLPAKEIVVNHLLDIKNYI